MKIAICASMTFSKEILEIKEKLESFGHIVTIPQNTSKYANNSIKIENAQEKKELDLISKYYEKIKTIDAIIVLNLTKRDIENYIGPNSFLEIGFAHVLKKKIFLYNPLPDMIYNDELKSMNIIFLNGKLNNLS